MISQSCGVQLNTGAVKALGVNRATDVNRGVSEAAGKM